MICYSVTHNRSGKRYIGISRRDLDVRRAEHESHSGHGSRTVFHSALRKYGKGNFTWKVLAEGETEAIGILERVLIAEWRTLAPRGFNSTNEAYEHELPPTNDELSFFEEMDLGVAEIEMAYDLLDVLHDSMNDKRFTQKAKELMKPLISHLKEGDCFGDC